MARGTLADALVFVRDDVPVGGVVVAEHALTGIVGGCRGFLRVAGKDEAGHVWCW